VADAASQTFRVKVTVENADAGWISGLKVNVSFTDPRAAVDDGESGAADMGRMATVGDQAEKEAGPPTLANQ
jgi:hypothetical protein